MDSLPLSLEPRPFQGLLTGLIKKNFYGDKDITVEFLAEELFSTIEELEEGQHVSEITLYEKVIVVEVALHTVVLADSDDVYFS